MLSSSCRSTPRVQVPIDAYHVPFGYLKKGHGMSLKVLHYYGIESQSP